MPSLLQTLTARAGGAFAALGLDPAFGLVRPSDRPDLCQFQCNGAMPAAKAAGRPPREIAQAVAEALAGAPEVARAEVAGPGFINIDAHDAAIGAALGALSGSRCGLESPGQGTVIVDYVGANVAKAMHAGHLRPAIIGDALKRLFAFAGYRTLGDVHLGDYGLQMGQIISALEAEHPNWPYFTGGPYPTEPPFTYAELEDVYPRASAACKADPARLEAARAATAAFQNGHAGYRALWHPVIELSINDIRKNLDSIDVKPEVWKGESDAADSIEPLREVLISKHLLIKDEGAEVVPVSRPDDTQEVPPLLYTKSDGAATYATTDCATLYDRVSAYKDLQRVLYVVDARQKLHFAQVFRAMRAAGVVPDAVALDFIGFGTMNGPDGRPFKTRAGGLPRFDDIVAQALDKARARLAEAGLADDINTARAVMMATLKFADLSAPPQADTTFDLERMTAFEGRTGPYVLYQAVRAGALLAKAGGAPTAPPAVLSEADRPLALTLAALPEAYAAALEGPSPHPLAEHAWRVARDFARFYGACHVLSEPDPATRAARLALTAAARAQLVLLLSLMGIPVPERM
jgi:arginyl-tRNA synthetase